MSVTVDEGAVNIPAWQQEGTVLDHQPSGWDEVRRASGLLWEPVFAPNFGYLGRTASGAVTHDPADAVSGKYVKDTDAKRVLRDDNGAKLSVRDELYALITHAEMGAVMEALLGLGLVYESAGELMGGRRVWALVRLDEPVRIPGDTSQVYPFMALLNRHDGTGAFKALATSVRIRCSNTWSAAEAQAEKSSAVFTFRHHNNWRDHIEDAKAAVTGQRKSFARYVEIAEDLARTKVTPAQEELFVVQFIPVPPGKIVTDRVMANVEQARQAIRDILASQTVEGAGIGGTAYGLVSAAGEYLDHVRDTRKEGALVQRQLLAPNRLKIEATKLVREVIKS